MSDAYRFSLVVPLYNEADNVMLLHEEILRALHGYVYEIIYVNDGSADDTYARLRHAVDAQHDHVPVKIISLAKNFGQSLAFKVALDAAASECIVAMDGDLQSDPHDIPRLLDMLEHGYDLVQGYRRNRHDPFFSKILPSKLANILLRRLCNSKFHDVGCTLKTFKKEIAQNMTFQQGMHRMLPVYFCLKGACVAELVVHHRSREYGISKYGFSRTFEVLFEIIKINFFERNSNGFIFLTFGVALCVLVYGIGRSIVAFAGNMDEMILYAIVAILGFYVMIIAASLHIVRSLYAYYVNMRYYENAKIEMYENTSR